MVYLFDELQDDFHKYLVYYSLPFTNGYDGIHCGGIKGIKKFAPESAKRDFKDYVSCVRNDKVCGWKELEYREIEGE